MQIERLIAYVDGFNLYYGLRTARLNTSRWLDIHGLCLSLLNSTQQLDLVRYFTTRVKADPKAADRQAIFIDALLARGGIEIDYGHFLSKRTKCHECGVVVRKHEEKKTDVNIAVRLIEDAYDDRFDTALLISGDSDLVPLVESLRTRFSSKQIVVAAPPNRWSTQLAQAANAAFQISPLTIRSNRLPDPVKTSDGVMLRAPVGWLPR